MSLHNYFVIALAFIIVPAVSFSQETISLEKAVKIAIENNPNISTIQNSITIQNQNSRVSKGSLFPSLSVSGGWSKNNTYSKGGIYIQNGFPVTLGDQRSWRDNFSLSLNSQVTLYNGFANYRQIDLDDANLASLSFSLEKTKRDVVFDVNQKFFDVIKKEKVQLANEENLKDSRDLLEKIKVYVSVGKKVLSDVYKQDVQVAQDELTLESSINDFRKAKIDFLYSLNADVNKEFVLDMANIKSDYTLADLQFILQKYDNTDKLVSAAISNRYDYRKTLQDIKSNEINLDIAKKILYFPRLTANGNYNLNGNDYTEIGNTRVFSFGVSLVYPIFQGFQTDVTRQISEVNLKQKHEDLSNLEVLIKSDIKKAKIDLETSYKQVEILDRNIASAQQDKILSEETFRLGLGTLLDMQVAQTKLNSLLISRINAIYNFIIFTKQIEYLTGQLNY